ncbi:MAG: biotin transporter BioY [Lachnospiraceae bacterium]|nr:biotin transporter BioY [Lachnospiraceae bacterium]
MIRSNNLGIKKIVSIALMTAVICVLSPFAIAIPMSPVPITLTTFAIYLTAIILGGVDGLISVIVYVLLGFAGAPVFIGFTGGALKVLGPTGGYIIGYIFLAIVEGAFVERARGSAMIFVGMLLGTIVLYIFGTIWLMRQSVSTIVAAFIAGVVPFVIGDIVKMIVALFVGVKIRKILIRNNLI